MLVSMNALDSIGEVDAKNLRQVLFDNKQCISTEQ